MSPAARARLRRFPGTPPSTPGFRQLAGRGHDLDGVGVRLRLVQVDLAVQRLLADALAPEPRARLEQVLIVQLPRPRGRWLVQDLLERVTRGSAESKGIGKQALYAQIDLDQPKAYAYAVEVMASTSQLPEAREWMAAFLEKRKPRWRRGRP